MPVVQISSALPPLISGGTSSLFNDADVQLSSPLTRRRRRTPLFDDDEDDEEEDENEAQRATSSSGSGSTRAAYKASRASLAFEEIDEDEGDEGAHTLPALGRGSTSSSSTIVGNTQIRRLARFDSVGSLAGSDPGVSSLDMGSDRQRRSSVAGPSSASSSSLKVISRSASLRIVSRASGAPAGSSLADQFDPDDQKIRRVGGKGSSSLDLSHGDHSGTSSQANDKGSSSGEGSMSLSSLGGVGGVRAFGSSLSRASPIPVPASSSTSSSSSANSSASSSSIPPRPRPPPLESINTSVHSSGSSLSDREQLPSAGGLSSTTTRTTSSSRTSTSSSDAAIFSLRSLGSHRNSTDSSISSLDESGGGAGGISGSTRSADGLGAFVRSSKGKGKSQVHGSVQEQWDDSDRTSVAEVREVEQELEPGQEQWQEHDADTEVATSPSTVQADHSDPVSESVPNYAGIREGATDALEVLDNNVTPSEPAQQPVQAQDQTQSSPGRKDILSDSSPLDFRRPSHALQIPIIKDAMPFLKVPDSSPGKMDSDWSETASNSTETTKAISDGPEGDELFTRSPDHDELLRGGRHGRHSLSPRRFSDRVRPTPSPDMFDQQPLLDEKKAQETQGAHTQSGTAVQDENKLGGLTINIVPNVGSSSSGGSSHRARSPGIAPLSAYPGSSKSSSSLVGPSSGTRAAVSGASYAYGFGYDSGSPHADAYGEAHLPRRHSGVFLQRTRSALSIGRRPDVNTSFGTGGHAHGRAGRKGASSSTSRSSGQGEAVWDQGGGGAGSSAADLQADFWASAPFSALEARNRAFAMTAKAGAGSLSQEQRSGPGSSVSGVPRFAPAPAVAVSQPASPRLSAFTPNMGALLSPSILRSGFIGGFNFTPLPAAVAPAGAPGAKAGGATVKVATAGPDAQAGSGKDEEGKGDGQERSRRAQTAVTLPLGTLPPHKQPSTGDEMGEAKVSDSSAQIGPSLDMTESGILPRVRSGSGSFSNLATVSSSTSSSSSMSNINAAANVSSNTGSTTSSSGPRSIPPSRRSSRLALPPLEERRAITPDEIVAATNAVGAAAAAGGATSTPPTPSSESFSGSSLSHPTGFGFGHARSHHHVHALSGPAGIPTRSLPLAVAVPSVMEAPAALGGAGASLAEVPASPFGMGVRPLTLAGILPGSSYLTETGETSAAVSPTNASAGGVGGESGSGGGLPPRPILARALTNVHYTPTTEEWSRFLARQGVGLSPHTSPNPVAASVSGASASGRGRTRSSRLSGATDGGATGGTSGRLSASVSSLRSGEEGWDTEREREREATVTPATMQGPERLASLTFSSPSSASTTPTTTTDSETMSPPFPAQLDSFAKERRVREDTNETVGIGIGLGAAAEGHSGASLGALRSPFETEVDRFAGPSSDSFPPSGANESGEAASGGTGDAQSMASVGSPVGVMERIKALSRTWSASAINSVLPQDLARSLLGTPSDSLDVMPSTQEEEEDNTGATRMQQHFSGSQNAGTYLSRSHSRAHTSHTPSASTSGDGLSSSSSGSSFMSHNDDVDDDEPLHALQAAVSRSPSVSGGLGSGVGLGAGPFAGLMSSASASTPRMGSGGAAMSSPLLVPQAGSGAFISPTLSRSPDRHWNASFLGVPSSPTDRRDQSDRGAGDSTFTENTARIEMEGVVDGAKDEEPMYGSSPTMSSSASPPLPVGQGGPGTTRSIDDFVVIAEIGRGAYGLVKKVRLRGSDGRPIGEPYIVKFIIKSRILADCWRRHKTLGPIPIEIHVLDQLRRIPFIGTEGGEEPPWAPSRMFGLDNKDVSSEDSRRASSSGSGFASATIEDVAQKADNNETARQRTRSLASHPALCEMVEFFEDHEFYYLVMPCFGRGQDLFDFVEAAPEGLPSAQVRSILGQVADALRHLHANNIVHRDIKDENVILDGAGNAQLIDFGSAAHVRPGRLFDTFSGTLDYAAAEILRGEKYGGKEQDVWALGVVAYVLLCGETPFWNGEEAIAGLTEGTRAAAALDDRCALHLHHHQQHDDDEGDVSSVDNSPATKVIVSMMHDDDDDDDLTEAERDLTAQAELDKGQSDGGGRVTDGADLIRQCLELDMEKRPTAEQVCSHRFLVGGKTGWVGERGWTRAEQEP
ncbi:hypothetical protein CF327_g5638 [Tilletia walkeri]|nr:hypothetical protein CF327_g5638 [Tilletia walkeri]